MIQAGSSASEHVKALYLRLIGSADTAGTWDRIEETVVAFSSDDEIIQTVLHERAVGRGIYKEA